jgi:hypothetical protein
MPRIVELRPTGRQDCRPKRRIGLCGRGFDNRARKCDRAAKERVLGVGGTVWAHNPARKPKVPKTRSPVWSGPYRIKIRMGLQKCCVEDTYANERVVRIDRLKLANGCDICKRSEKGSAPLPQAPKATRKEVNCEPTVTRHRPILIPGPQVADPTIPAREPLCDWRTPDEAQVRETPELERTDRNDVTPDMSRSRRVLGTNREEPPMTRSRTRLQIEPDAGEALCRRYVCHSRPSAV